MSARKVMLSAMRPSNELTLGNYLGALINWVKLQDQYDCLFFTVDLHTIDEKMDAARLRELSYTGLATYIAAGIDPNKALLFAQSHVPHHLELAWILNCFTYMGELSRMTQYKDKSSKAGANIPASLFNYPVLMAADILLYQTALVPVGDDQKQHLELARDLALRLNNYYDEKIFTVPEVYIPPVGARIMSLQNPTAKMSKSDQDPGGAVLLTDSDAEITKKFKRAVTDSGTEITYDPEKPGIKNLLDIQAAITGKSAADLVASYRGKMYGHLKVETAEIVVGAVGPIRDEVSRLLADKSYLDGILRAGAEKAAARAEQTVAKLRDKIGLLKR